MFICCAVFCWVVGWLRRSVVLLLYELVFVCFIVFIFLFIFIIALCIVLCLRKKKRGYYLIHTCALFSSFSSQSVRHHCLLDLCTSTSLCNSNFKMYSSQRIILMHIEIISSINHCYAS